ncbi:MAG: hypothetical protein LBR55_03995 [Bacteroidales bacterium]|nr:hypothetical protein [Bacteroidales bacterium]
MNKTNAEFRIQLNAAHYIYQAHFPNNPITPGVCLIQIVGELFEIVKHKKFSIQTLKNVKFTAPINPLEHSKVTVLLDYTEKDNMWLVKAVIKEQEQVFAKMSLLLSAHAN